MGKKVNTLPPYHGGPRYNLVLICPAVSEMSFENADHAPIKVLRATVKVMVNSLAAGCQSFYRKIYEHFYSVQDGHCPL